jgi:hypothetical protein
VVVHRLSKVAATWKPVFSRIAAGEYLADHPNEALPLLDFPSLE